MSENYEPLPSPPRNREEYDAWLSTGQADRLNRERQDTIKHAENWYNNAKHLVDPENHPHIEKRLMAAKRGMMTGAELNESMKDLAGPIYTSFDPSDVQMTIPNHLSDQFK